MVKVEHDFGNGQVFLFTKPTRKESDGAAAAMKGNMFIKHPCVDEDEMDYLISKGVQPSQLSLVSEDGPPRLEWIESTRLK